MDFLFKFEIGLVWRYNKHIEPYVGAGVLCSR